MAATSAAGPAESTGTSHGGGLGYATRERVAGATGEMNARARSSPDGVSHADAGHGVDAMMDRITSQSGMHTGNRGVQAAVRESLEGHRREMQLASIARAAARAQKAIKLPTGKKTHVAGAAGSSFSVRLAVRDQRTGGPTGASALNHDPRVGQRPEQGPAAARGRTERSGREERKTASVTAAIPGVRPQRTQPQRPVVPGGYDDVHTPPPRPRSGGSTGPSLDRARSSGLSR